MIEAETNLGFAGGNEVGVRHATAECVCFLNPDVTVGPGWLEAARRRARRPGGRDRAPRSCIDPDGSLQEAGQLLYPDVARPPSAGRR